MFKTFERDLTSGPALQILISVGFYVNQLGKHPEVRSTSKAVSEVTWVQVPFLLFTNFVTLGKLFNLS